MEWQQVAQFGSHQAPAAQCRICAGAFWFGPVVRPVGCGRAGVWNWIWVWGGIGGGDGGGVCVCVCVCGGACLGWLAWRLEK